MKEEIIKYQEHADFDGSDIVVSRQPLVRCKDCKYSRADKNGLPKLWCRELVDFHDADWFCADGERRQDNLCEDCERDCHMCGMTIENDRRSDDG